MSKHKFLLALMLSTLLTIQTEAQQHDEFCGSEAPIVRIPINLTGTTCNSDDTVSEYTGVPTCVIQNIMYPGKDTGYEIHLNKGNDDIRFELETEAADLALALTRKCDSGEECVVSSVDFIDPEINEVIRRRAYSEDVYHLRIDSAHKDSCGPYKLSITGHNPAVDLAIELKASPTPTEAGSALLYTLTVRNKGLLDATGVTVIDTLPSEVRFSAAPGCSESGKLVTCEIGDLAAGDDKKLEIMVTTPSDPAIELLNTARVTSTELDRDTSDNKTSLLTSMVGAKLTLFKSDSPATSVESGEPITYTIMVDNVSRRDAVNVRVRDELPQGVGSPEGLPGNCQVTDQVIECALGTIAAGSQSLTTFEVTPLIEARGKTIENEVWVTADNAAEQWHSNNIRVKGLDITKSASPSNASKYVLVGRPVTYHITVDNFTSRIARDVMVTDRLPDGVILVGGSLPSDLCSHLVDEGSIVCELGDIAPADYPKNIRFDVKPTVETLIENVATVTSTNIVEHSASVSTTVVDGVVWIDVRASPSNYVVKEQPFVYDITVDNLSSRDAVEVEVTNKLPEGVTLAHQGLPAICTVETDGLIRCELGDMAPEDRKVIQLQVIPSSEIVDSEIVNRATVSALEAYEMSDTARTQVVDGVLELSMKGSPEFEVVKEKLLTYTITVENQSSMDVQDVRVINTLPEGVKRASEYLLDERCIATTARTIECDLNTIASGDMPVVINLRAIPSAETLNTSIVSRTTLSAKDVSNLSVTERTRVVDGKLKIDKVDALGHEVVVGNPLTYKIEVKNLSTEDVSEVMLTDTLPRGVVLEEETLPVSCKPIDTRDIECSLETIEPQETISIEFDVIPGEKAAGESLVNRATVRANDASEQSDSARTEVIAGLLSIEKFASPSHSVRVGHPLTYTIKINNVSSVNATDVMVTDNLPEGVTLNENSLPRACRASTPETIQCSLGTIAPEDAPTFLVFEVSPKAEVLGTTLRNQATVRTIGSPDRSASVNTAVIEEGPEISCIPPIDPLAWFPMDEDFGIISADIARANQGWHHYGPTFTAGKVDGALDFDGIDDYVEIANDPSLSLTSSSAGELSIALWIKTERDSGPRRPRMTLLSKRGAPLSETLAQLHGYRLDISDGILGLWLNDTLFTSSTHLPYGGWHHIAVTVDRDDPMGGRWYLDGVETATFNPSDVRGLLDSSAPLRIGRSSFRDPDLDNSGSHFRGALDEIQIFDRAISGEEVRGNFEASSAGICKETFYLASETPICIDEPSGTGDVVICNHSAKEHQYWINLAGIPAADCNADVDGPMSFDLLTAQAQPVDVDPRSCQRVRFRADRPEGMTDEGLNACYRVDVFNTVTGFIDSRQASLQDSGHWCAAPSNELPVDLPLGEDRVIAFNVANSDATSSLLDYEIATPGSAVSLRQRDELPDEGRSSVSGSVEIPAGGSVTISAIAELNEVGLLDLHDVLLKEQNTEPVLATSGVRPAASRRNALALHRDRFEVRIEWQAFDGASGSGIVAPFQTSQAGVFWFFTTDNWEILIKVLDGCSINQHFWVFAAAATNIEFTLTVTDTHTGQEQSYFNPMGTVAPAITDVRAFSACSDKEGFETTLPPDKQTSTMGSSSEPVITTTGVIEPEAGGCIPAPDRLCLLDGRFSLELDWETEDGETGMAQVVPVASDHSGLLWFFHSNHWEMLVKIIDRCEADDRYWMFAAATTDVGYTLTVTNTETGLYKEYSNPLNNAADAIVDTFATCP